MTDNIGQANLYGLSGEPHSAITPATNVDEASPSEVWNDLRKMMVRNAMGARDLADRDQSSWARRQIREYQQRTFRVPAQLHRRRASFTKWLTSHVGRDDE